MGIFVLECETDPDTEKESNVIIEGQSMVDIAVSSVSHAVALLFGVIYALNLTYPKEYKYFWEVIQRIIMKLDDGRNLSPKVQGLNDKLTSAKQQTTA